MPWRGLEWRFGCQVNFTKTRCVSIKPGPSKPNQAKPGQARSSRRHGNDTVPVCPKNRYKAVRKAEASLWDLDAKRTTATVLPAWSQWTRSVVRPTLVADFRPTPLFSLQQSRRRSGRGARSSLSRLATSQTGMSAGRNLTDCYKIENAPQVCCLATRLRGLLSLVSKNFLNCDCKCNAHF